MMHYPIFCFRSFWAFLLLGSLTSCEPKPIDLPNSNLQEDSTGPTTLLWQTEIHGFDGFGHGITPQPLPNGSLAFIHDGDSATTLYHLNKESGKVLDSFAVFLPQAPSGQLTFPYSQGFEGTDLVAAYDGYIVRLNLITGSFNWATSEVYENTPSWQSGRYFVGPYSREGEPVRVYEFDVRTGAVKLVVEIPSLSPRSQTSIINSRVFTLDSGQEILTAYHKSIDWNEAPSYPDHGYIAGYDLANDKELWRISTQEAAGAETSSVYGDRLIQVVGDTLYSINPLTGSTTWRYWIGKSGDYPQDEDYAKHFSEVDPLVDIDMGYVYLGTKKHLVACVDVNTGEQVWLQEHSGGRMIMQDQDDGMITVLGTDFETYLLDKRSGNLLAKLEQRTEGSVARTGAYYDSTTRRIYLYDGARAYCYQLNFEPPGA